MGKDIKLSSGRVLVGDCVARMRDLPDCSVDAVVCDPPYELGFMGKTWDGAGIAYSQVMWGEALRVLKPGGHLLAFGGTRTYHRMACAIEDAGFEIRDSIHWMYGSGFPKSLDVSKAIDKGQGLNTERRFQFTAWMKTTGLTARQIDDITDTKMGNHYTTHPTQPAIATADLFDKLRPYLPEVPEAIERLVAERTGIEWTAYKQREVTGRVEEWSDRTNYALTSADGLRRDVPATDEARRWEGWGTALKPAHEPVVVARKPLIGTVAANVLAHGTGALNIDGSRIGTEAITINGQGNDNFFHGNFSGKIDNPNRVGRWPANIVLDETAAAALDQQNEGAARYFTQADYEEADMEPFIYQAKPSKAERNAGLDGAEEKVLTGRDPGQDAMAVPHKTRTKTTANHHPTVKPVALMRHLVRLVTPPGGTVLDPFLGSGTTAVAATLEGFTWIGCEMTDDYLPIIRGRVAWAEGEVAAGRADKPQHKTPTPKKTKPEQPTLDDGQQQ